jgi:hypothetical protein
MNVTDDGIKYCQRTLWDLPQKDSAERESYAGVYASSWITENNITNATNQPKSVA